MKKNFTKTQIGGSLMKILSLTIMLAFIAPVVTNAQAGKTNFAGTWAYSAEKSTQPQGGGGQGGGGNRNAGNIVVKQEANLLSVERTRPGQDGTPQTTTMKYTLDGKESVNSSARGDSKSVATWSADGKTLTIVTKSTFGERETTITVVWALKDAKTLTQTSTRPGQDGATVTTVAAYDMK